MSRSIAERIENFKNGAATSSDPRDFSVLLGRIEDVKDLLHLLEEKMNTGLLRLFARGLGTGENPMETLLLSALNSRTEQDQRQNEDLQKEVNR